MNEPDPEITGLFVQESAEHLERLERELLDLEDDPRNAELLASVFRSVHTIKGTSGFLGFTHLQDLTHAGEEVLASLRDGRLGLTPEVTSALLALIDDVRTVLADVERTGSEGPADHAPTIGRLRALLATGADPSNMPVAEPMRAPAPGSSETARAPAAQPLQPPGTEQTEPGSGAGATAAASADAAQPALAHLEPDGDGTPKGSAPSREAAVASDTSVRLAVDVLDRIMDLTGELVVLRSRLSAVVADDDAAPVTPIHRDLRLVTSGLQAEVMRARLQPVGVVLGRLRRIARDLARGLGKQVHVEIAGEDVAVDRAINDALRDPLLHLVRNAVDHGLESPQDRIASGKDPVGELTITASHARGRVRIEVCDDGRGLDLVGLRRRAEEAGLLGPEEAQGLSDRDAADLALQPGVSTKADVTTLSGRGVGLDVVRTVLATVGGRVDIATEAGRGTRFRVNVPLTLAMLPVLTVSCEGFTYCLPQANVLEVRDLRGDESAVATVDDVPIYRLRGQLLPLVSLAGLLHATPGHEVLADATRVVILETDQRRFALAVAGAGDTLDVVVKPMTPETRGIPVYMGVSVLADGQPALILDVAGVADAAGVTSRAEAAAVPDLPSAPASESAIVLATIEGGGVVAVRLADVLRLERFPRDRVKRRGDADAVMYGDEIMPLARVAEVLPERRRVPRNGSETPPYESDAVATIVCRVGDHVLGLVVQQIVDVVPEPPAPTQPAGRPGVIASIYVREQFAELLDLPVLVEAAYQGWTR